MVSLHVLVYAVQQVEQCVRYSLIMHYASIAVTKLCNSVEQTLPPARLLTPMHVNLPYKKLRLQQSSWGWTLEVRNTWQSKV